MSGVSSANESQGVDKEGGAAVLMTPPLLLDHASGDAPPPAPPPPPPLPTAKPVERKRKGRSFYWKPISEDRVKKQDGPNLWSLSRHSRENPFHIDIRAMEELFGQHQDTSGKIRPGRASVKDLRQQITILDSKRSLNISIYLKHFKKSSECLLDDVLHGHTGVFSVESLKELLKLLPEEDEVKSLQMFNGNPKDLAPPDAFIHRLIQLPRYEVRLEALLLKEELFPSVTVMKHDIAVILTAVKELLNCQELHSVLHLVLQAGNIMNAGGSAGNAVGFKLSSLLSLADTKANKPGINLLHFVALEAQKKDLLMFPEKLLHVQQASRVCVDSIHVEFHALTGRVDQLQQKVQSDAELQTQLQSFVMRAAEALQDLSISIDELQREEGALIDFFCEDKDTLKLDECLRIFQNFCNKFKKAVQENVERGMWEESRRKRLKEWEDKRHSWAGHEGVGGALGLRSNSEADVEAALKKEGFLDILHSPLLRFGGARRSRQQKNVTFDPCGTDTHVLPPIHSLSIADAASRPSSATGTHIHNDPNTGRPAPHGNHSECDSIPKDHSTSTEQPVIQKNTLPTRESPNNDFQLPEVTPNVTFDPSQVVLNEDHSEPTSTTRDNLPLSCQSLNDSLNTSAGVTQSVQTSSKRPIASKHKPSASTKSPSASVKPPSSSSSPKCAAASETASLRKVVPLRQPRIQDRPIWNVLKNGKTIQTVRTTPGEKICRATLDHPSPRTSTVKPPSFARNTVASTTRSAATPGNRPSAPKAPPLTRTAALRLSQAHQRQETATGSARPPPPAGRQRKSSSAASGNSFIRGSRDKSVKPVWR